MNIPVKPTIRTEPLVLSALQCQPYRLTVQQYERMAEAGILTKYDRVELLRGYLFEKLMRNAPHDSAVSRIVRRFMRVLPTDWTLRVQSAIVLRDSEPEPDFAVVRGSEETYDERKPVARDIGLLIEVSDSSLPDDRGIKAQLYAEARIQEYWIVNVVDDCLELLTKPRAGRLPGYRAQRVLSREDSIALTLDGVQMATFSVNELLPG